MPAISMDLPTRDGPAAAHLAAPVVRAANRVGLRQAARGPLRIPYDLAYTRGLNEEDRPLGEDQRPDRRVLASARQPAR